MLRHPHTSSEIKQRKKKKKHPEGARVPLLYTRNTKLSDTQNEV